MLFICEKLILIKKNFENKNKNTKNIKKNTNKKREKKIIEVKNRYSNKYVSRNSYFINLSNN